MNQYKLNRSTLELFEESYLFWSFFAYMDQDFSKKEVFDEAMAIGELSLEEDDIYNYHVDGDDTTLIPIKAINAKLKLSLFKKLSKLFKLRYEYSKGVGFARTNPSKAAYYLFPGRFTKSHHKILGCIQEFLGDNGIVLPGTEEYYQILNSINFKKGYNKLCKWFQKNITKEDIDFLINDNGDWYQNRQAISGDVTRLYDAISFYS